MEKFRKFRSLALIFLCLSAFFSLTAFSCEDDEDEPQNENPIPDRPDRPDNPDNPSGENLLTGRSPYKYPILKWYASPSQIKSSEKRELLEDDTNSDEPMLIYNGEGNVLLYMYMFDGNPLKLEGAGMVMEYTDVEGFIDSILYDFDWVDNGDDDYVLYVSKGGSTILILEVESGYVYGIFMPLDEAMGVKARSYVNTPAYAKLINQVKAKKAKLNK